METPLTVTIMVKHEVSGVLLSASSGWMAGVSKSAVKWLWLLVCHLSLGNRISWDDSGHADLTDFQRCQQGLSVSQTFSTWPLDLQWDHRFLRNYTQAQPQPAHPPLRNISTVLSLDTFRLCNTHHYYCLAVAEASVIRFYAERPIYTEMWWCGIATRHWFIASKAMDLNDVKKYMLGKLV